MSTADIPEWVKPGAEVMEVFSSSWGRRYGVRLKISKVHKTGNFLVEGREKQYHPGNEFAWRAGSAYDGERLYPLTQEVLDEAEHAGKVSAARRAVSDEAERLRRLRDDDDLLAAHAEILSRRPKADEAAE